MYHTLYKSRKTLKSLILNHTKNVKSVQNKGAVQHIPRPRALPFVGTKLDFMAAGGATRLHEYIDRRHKQLGPIFSEKLGGNSELVFISDPHLIKALFLSLEGKYPEHILPDPWVLYEKLYGSKRGLFFMKGEEWLINRRIMNKNLLKEDSESWITPPIKLTIANFIEKWKAKAANTNFVPDLETEFYRLSTDVIVALLMGNKVNSMMNSKHYEDLMQLFSESVKQIFRTTTKLYLLPASWYQMLNLKVWRDFKQSVDNSLYLAQKIVTEMLNNKTHNDGLIFRLCKDNVPNEIIIRIAADFVIAAGDTTAYTLIWNLYSIANYTNGQIEILNKDRIFVNNYVKETMRLYPVAPFLTRILHKECNLGQYNIQKGTPVVASIYTSGRDEQNFSKADEFLPYRWDRNDFRRLQLDNHVTSASLPFALGARSCIGKKIAMVMLTEAISQIVQNFDFSSIDNAPVNAITSQILIPDRPVNIKFSLRKQQ